MMSVGFNVKRTRCTKHPTFGFSTYYYFTVLMGGQSISWRAGSIPPPAWRSWLFNVSCKIVCAQLQVRNKILTYVNKRPSSFSSQGKHKNIILVGKNLKKFSSFMNYSDSFHIIVAHLTTHTLVVSIDFILQFIVTFSKLSNFLFLTKYIRWVAPDSKMIYDMNKFMVEIHAALTHFLNNKF